MGAILTQPQGAVGNILGPGAWSDNALIRADGDNSNKVQGSPIICTDGGAVTGMASLEITGLTASRLVGTSAGKLLQSEDLASWVDGTVNQITVTDDTDGTITLSAPQDIHTGASPTFAGLTLTGNITMPEDGSIGIAGPAERIVFDGSGGLLAFTDTGVSFAYGHLLKILSADVPWTIQADDGIFNGTRDDILTIGYNVQDSSTNSRWDGSEPLLKLTLEANYDMVTANLMELNLDYLSSDGGTTRRPMASTINRATHSCQWVWLGADHIWRNDTGATRMQLSETSSVLYINLPIGLGTTTVPHDATGQALMAFDGPNASALGPHLQFTTDSDQYPLMQIWNWSHDQLGIFFDSYFDGLSRSSTSTGNFFIQKTSGLLRFQAESGIGMGGSVAWLSAFDIQADAELMFSPGAALKTYWRDVNASIHSSSSGVLDVTATSIVVTGNITMPEDGSIGIAGPAERIVFDGTGGIVRVADADLEIASAAPKLLFADSDGDDFSITVDAGLMTFDNIDTSPSRFDFSSGHLGIGNSAPTAGHILIASESYATTGTVIGYGCFPEYAPTSAATANTITSIQGNTWFSTANWGAGSRVQCLDFYPAPLLAGTAFGSANLDISAINTAGILNILGRTITANTVTGIAVTPLTNIFGGTDDTTANVVRGIYVYSAAATTGTWGRLTGIEVEPQTSGVINQGIWLAGDGVGSDLVFGAGQDARIYYDGTDMKLVTDLVAASDFVLDCGTEKTLELAEVVWDDINFGAGEAQLPVASAPGVVTFTDNGGGDTGISTVGYAVGEKLSYKTEILHKVKDGSDIYFHVHFQTDDAPTGTDYVKFQIDFTITRDGTTCAPTTTISKEVPVDTQYEQIRADFDLVSGTSLLIGDQIKCTLSRVASTGDAYAGEAKLVTFGIHVQLDTVGSRQRFVK